MSRSQVASGGAMESIVRIPSVTGVDVELKIAGPGGRSYAFVIDWHIRFLAAAAWFIVGTVAFEGGLRLMPANEMQPSFMLVVVAPSLVIYFLSPPVLEVLLHGQTPGKRI